MQVSILMPKLNVFKPVAASQVVKHQKLVLKYMLFIELKPVVVHSQRSFTALAGPRTYWWLLDPIYTSFAFFLHRLQLTWGVNLKETLRKSGRKSCSVNARMSSVKPLEFMMVNLNPTLKRCLLVCLSLLLVTLLCLLHSRWFSSCWWRWGRLWGLGRSY